MKTLKRYREAVRCHIKSYKLANKRKLYSDSSDKLITLYEKIGKKIESEKWFKAYHNKLH